MNGQGGVGSRLLGGAWDRRLAHALLVLLIALASGCRSLPGAAPSDGLDLRPLAERIADPERVRQVEEIALTLLPVDAWPAERVLRQRVRVEWSGREESFDAVLQRRPGELSLLGLGPMNLVGFRLSLLARAPDGDGPDELIFENRSGRALPFSPTHILADVQRVFYPWSSGAPDCRSCQRSSRWGAVAIFEEVAGGQLVERRFEIPTIPDAGRVRIRYADWQGDPAVPNRVVIENGWFGYRLTIDTLETVEAKDPTPGN